MVLSAITVADLLHSLPIDESLALAVKLHSESYNLSFVGLERLHISARLYLLLGGSESTVVG